MSERHGKEGGVVEIGGRALVTRRGQVGLPRGISGQLAKDPRSKGDTRHSGSIVYLGVSPMSAGKVKVNLSSLHQMNHIQHC